MESSSIETNIDPNNITHRSTASVRQNEMFTSTNRDSSGWSCLLDWQYVRATVHYKRDDKVQNICRQSHCRNSRWIRSIQWQYVTKEFNPADDTSRGKWIQSFKKKDKWLNGPWFLWKPIAEWPTELLNCQTIPVDDPGVKSETVLNAVLLEESIVAQSMFTQEMHRVVLKAYQEILWQRCVYFVWNHVHVKKRRRE